MSTEALGRDRRGGAERRRQALPRLETALEALLGNRLGAGVYRRWVEGLGFEGAERVLEIGTGAGACARHLAAALPKGSLTCLERDPRWLYIARHRLTPFGLRVEFVEADAAEWTRPSAFDVGVAHFVLHDIAPDVRQRVLANAAQSLAPNGCLCIREPLGHGLSGAELRWQLNEAGLELVGDERVETIPLMGETVSGVWQAW